MRQIGPALKIFLFLTFMTGVVYPVLVTTVGQFLFPQKSTGEMISRNGQVIGSKWIGQKFVNEKYFWGRPSAIDYNPLPSGGSNLGPTSEALKKAVTDRALNLRKAHELSENEAIPQELLFASGSGLDPEISPTAALFQVNRVAKSRGINDKQILVNMVNDHIENPDLGFIGEPRINVLKLNLALDEMTEGLNGK